MPQIKDPEVSILVACSETLREEYGELVLWEGSPFAWIKMRPSRQVGAIGEKLVSGYLATKGFDVTRSPDREADRLVNGLRAEIKFSTLWKNGSYTFQQLRDQNYNFVICLGISPFDAHCWVLPKDVIMEKWRAGEIGPQHGGQAGRDTAWLHVNPNSIPDWLQEWGGDLSKVSSLVSKVTGKSPL